MYCKTIYFQISGIIVHALMMGSDVVAGRSQRVTERSAKNLLYKTHYDSEGYFLASSLV